MFIISNELAICLLQNKNWDKEIYAIFYDSVRKKKKHNNYRKGFSKQKFYLENHFLDLNKSQNRHLFLLDQDSFQLIMK